jgi:hypothetical protein
VILKDTKSAPEQGRREYSCRWTPAKLCATAASYAGYTNNAIYGLERRRTPRDPPGLDGGEADNRNLQSLTTNSDEHDAPDCGDKPHEYHEIEGGPHNIGWTHAEELNPLFKAFLGK